MDSTTTVALVTGANQGIGRQVAEEQQQPLAQYLHERV